MNEAEFWKLIALSKQESDGDPGRQLGRLQQMLERQPESEIVDFDRLLHQQMIKSYTRDLWAAAYIINGGCSDDDFDCFRAWLIAQGGETFHEVLQNPETLADLGEANEALKPLLQVAGKAFHARTTTELDSASPTPADLAGDQWRDDEKTLQKKFPRLFEKFWGINGGSRREARPAQIRTAMELLRELAVHPPSAPPPPTGLFCPRTLQTGSAQRPLNGAARNQIVFEVSTGSLERTLHAAEVRIVSAQTAAERALCLRALLHRFEIEGLMHRRRRPSGPAATDNPDRLPAEARQITEWLQRENLWPAVSAHEQTLLLSPAGSWSAQALTNISWRAESLCVIGWALNLENQIAPYDLQVATSSPVFNLQILVPADSFIASARLRDEAEILYAREVAETWLWRARTTQIQKEPAKYPPPAGWTFEQIIRQAASHWEGAGLFQTTRGDYPARGKAYADLTEAEWHELRSIASERLYAANWLCRYSTNWDAVPTST
jgi:hypothetical protein